MKSRLVDVLQAAVEKYPDKTAVIFKDKRIDYKTLNSRANKLANGLIENFGLRKGDRVAVMLPNCAEYLEIYLAMAKSGLVMVPISFRFMSDEIEGAVNDSDAKALIIYEEFLLRIKEASWRFKNIRPGNYLYLGRDGKNYDSGISSKNPNGIDYEDFLARAENREPEAAISDDDVFFYGYTSGTTGSSKGAVRTHKADGMAVILPGCELNFSPNAASLMIMPLFHCNSIWFSLTTLALGGTVCVYPESSFDPEKILEIIEKEKITFISMVPTMYTIILELPEEKRKKYDVSSLKTLLCSSAPLMTKTKEQILAFFDKVKLYEGYGATEVGLVSLLQPEDQLRKIRCIGKPISGVEVKILNQNGECCAVGEVGELYIKSPAGFTEYHKNSKETAAAFCENWLTVGDMGKIDEEGYFYLVDRKKDVINSGGEKVFPVEVEEVISKCAGVREVAVIGVPDEKWGEKVVAVVVKEKDAEVAAENIISFCQKKLAGYKKPKEIEFVLDLPKSPTGKILRRQIREKYWREKEIKI